MGKPIFGLMEITMLHKYKITGAFKGHLNCENLGCYFFV